MTENHYTQCMIPLRVRTFTHTLACSNFREGEIELAETVTAVTAGRRPLLRLGWPAAVHEQHLTPRGGGHRQRDLCVDRRDGFVADRVTLECACRSQRVRQQQ